MVKVLIADDHPLYRAGLRQLLEDEGFQVVSEASTGKEAVDQALRTHPEVIIMDVRMPGMDGIAASRAIKGQLPSTEIVMVSGFEEDEDGLFRAIEAGARSYVGKHEDPNAILEAVHAASHGDAYLPPDTLQRLMHRLSRDPSAPATEIHFEAPLAPREKEVLRLLAAGRRNKEIAEELGLSVRSVSNYLAKIYEKLHIHVRSQVALFALRSGIADSD